MPRYHVTIRASDAQAFAGLVRDPQVPVLEGERLEDARFTVVSYMPEEQIRELERAGYEVTVHEDIDAGKSARLAEVGDADRYAERLARRRRASGS